MSAANLTPARLAVRLVLYFALVFGAATLVISSWPDSLQYFPLGGHDALESYDAERQVLDFPLSGNSATEDLNINATELPTADEVGRVVLFLLLHLIGTTLLMIPLTWTYMASKQDIGYRKNFVRALIILPICATTIVMLIQNSLALAFGLAALVAAVRFRVTLDEAIDGIFVFAAICVGLAAGVGYLGIAAVMTAFFCAASLILWALDYGENPLEQAQFQKKRAKLKSFDKHPSS